MTKFLFFFLMIFGWFQLQAQAQLLTVAEKSSFTSTSKYADVMNFIEDLKKLSPNIKVENITTSTEGREVPLLILADPMPANPENLADEERIVVYIQANIHAGEVEGKEAVQMLARDILNGKYQGILKDVILLIVPNLNPDGNEKISTENRTNQNGPVNGVGLRYNGQMLDLNRDAMKLETPEIQAVVSQVFNRWDPAITVDCHTTNGSYHEEPVTYTWMMNPNGNRSLINYMRDRMMPTVKTNLFADYQVENVFYGEFIDRLDIDKGWISYAAEPRYLVNYVGLRNRLAILNENYVYADFKTRVNGCYHLLLTIINYAAGNKKEIKLLLATADEKATSHFAKGIPLDSFTLEYEGRPTQQPITIKAFEADTIPGVKGYWRYKQSNRQRTVTVPYIADYFSTKNIALPYAYVIEYPIAEVEENLLRHGIKIERLKTTSNLKVQKFRIDELKGDERLNQGHYTNTIKGEYVIEKKEFPAGAALIKINQPLGKLAAYLLEPQSDDGLLKWNYFDRYLVPQWGGGYYSYPVYRVMENLQR
ncbi:MAG: M14 family metallopeptidase [Bacteroidales bacterium]|nr:M14 family metallopeptidase [Bacteroidales bacterium]MCF8458840.1 M14 family metallopeptidase [Bacteroidales bacterium]